jgi:hypothetical protein
MRRCILVAVLALTLVGLTAGTAAAKEDVEATLTTPVPLDAAPGDEITLAWKLTSVDAEGKRQPFGASGVYIRLFSAGGGEPTIGPAAGDDGRYEATVIVPEGGIRGVQIGLQGWASDPTGTYRSDLFFPITNNPLPAVTDTRPAAIASGPAPEPAVETASGVSAVLIAALALVCLIGLGAAAVLLRRRHPAAGY